MSFRSRKDGSHYPTGGGRGKKIYVNSEPDYSDAERDWMRTQGPPKDLSPQEIQAQIREWKKEGVYEDRLEYGTEDFMTGLQISRNSAIQIYKTLHPGEQVY